MALPFINSKNDYFFQDFNKLVLNWKIVDSYLIIKGYNWNEIEIYKKAYFYFIKYPDHFDGATMTEDLRDVFNLDLDAMLHDYYYVKYGVSASFRYTKIADDLFFIETLRKGKSSWNAGYRRVMLKLKSYCGFHLYVKYVLKREFTDEHKALFLSDVEILLKR